MKNIIKYTIATVLTVAFSINVSAQKGKDMKEKAIKEKKEKLEKLEKEEEKIEKKIIKLKKEGALASRKNTPSYKSAI